MNSEAAFLEAALPKPLILLNQELLPFSIGHQMILSRVGSPFAGPDLAATDLRGKLFTAVFICCQDFDTAWAALWRPELPKTFATWRKQCGKGGTLDIVRLAESFRAYIAQGSACPAFTRKFGRGSSAGPPGAPSLLLILQVLGQLGFSRSEALNCPLGLARWHYCAWYEQKGSLSIREGGIRAARKAMAKLGWLPMKSGGN